MNWLKKYQQGGSTYNPGGETSLKGINMYNPQQVTNPNMSLAEGSQPDPWAINNPNSQETMDDVYAGRDKKTQTPENQSYLKTTTKSTFGTPNWQYIQTANMIGDGLGFLAQQGPNSSQNAMKRYNDQKLDPLNTLMANPNTSAQDQAGSGYYKMGGWISKYQDGGSIDDEDEEYLFGLDDNEEQEETPEVTYSKRKNLQSQYAQEDQESMMRQMQQEAFFSSLVNTDPDNQSNNYSQYNNTNSSEKFIPQEREKQAYNFFRQKGLPDHIAAGIVGNLKYESNFDVSGVGDGGKARGLAQWHPDRYSKLQKQGFNMNSFEGNLEAIAHELTTSEKNALNALMKAKTPQEAAAVFDRKYERSAGLSTGKRAARAAQILNSYQEGGIIEDPMGQWNHPGEITRIPSNQITMQGVNYPVLGISDTGDTQMMQPNQDYSFDGESVTEYPMDYNMSRALQLGYQADETGHWPSVDSETGKWLKKKDHPTRGMELTNYMLDPNLNKDLQLFENEDGQMQYQPRMQKGGSVNWIDSYKQVADNASVQIPLPTGKSIVTDNTPDTQNSFLSKMEGLRNSVAYDEKEKQKRINSRKEATNIVDNKKGSFTFPTGQSKDYSQMSTKEKKYVQGLALENRGRIFENEESITDMLNPLNWIGSMASNMSKAPYEAEQTNSYMPYAIALAEPLLMGRMMGSGTINPFSKKMWTNEISDKAFINTLGMGIPKKFSKKPSTILQDNIIPDNVVPPITSEPWQLKELPGLHIKSTMTGSPLEKQLSKQGEININSLSSYLGKSDVGQQDKYIINKVLAERFPNQAKINYNDFRKAVSEELIPLEKNFTKENANYGLHNLGYVESPLENTSITFSNKSKLGIGSNEHFINDGTLGHTRVLVSKEEPKTMHVLESQSDYYQKNKTAEIADNLESAKENYKLSQIDYPDMKDVNDFWKRRIDELQSTLDKHNTSPNKIQKEFLGKTHQERLLQENMLYAAQQGKKSVRYPTSETAAKIQGYTKQHTNRPEALENNLPEIPTEIRFGENTQTQEFYRGEDYLPEHKTILKKYDNAPKMIKKTLGVDTKIVTDPKGNTWYEFDIPEAAKKRKFEMKALSIPTAIATGAATQEFKEGGQINNWIDKYKK